MPVIGVRIDKIEAQRNPQIKAEGAIRIAPLPRILAIQENQMQGTTGRINVLEAAFEYTANYDPALGNITTQGTVIFQAGEKERKDALRQWQEERKLPQNLGQEIMFAMTQRAFLILMNMAREVGLPSPMQVSVTPQRVEEEEKPGK
ncbi:MAG: hypothetical protein ACE5HW_04400 [Candidatus Methanofastidiosia archaeon]